MITSTPPKFSRPPPSHGADGSTPDGYKEENRWSDKKPVASSAIPAYKPAASDVTDPKKLLPEEEGEAAEEEKIEKLSDPEEPKMMREDDCSAKKASTMEPLPALNTTFHVPDDMHYSFKGPDPSEVVIVTASDGKGHNGGIDDILGQTAANRKAYCEHHGYNYHFVNISKFDIPDAHPVWKKIPAIVDAFNQYPKAQWVFFLDLDAIIMSPKQDLNSLILSHAGLAKSLDFGVEWHRSDRIPLGVYMPNQEDVKFDEIDMLVTQDHNGINAGSFFLRRSKFTQWMLDIWADPFFMRHDWPGQEQDTLVCSLFPCLLVRQSRADTTRAATFHQASQSFPPASRVDQAARCERVFGRRRDDEVADG